MEIRGILARLKKHFGKLAMNFPYDGDRLFALPIKTCGLRLDDKAVRVAVGL